MVGKQLGVSWVSLVSSVIKDFGNAKVSHYKNKYIYYIIIYILILIVKKLSNSKSLMTPMTLDTRDTLALVEGLYYPRKS